MGSLLFPSTLGFLWVEGGRGTLQEFALPGTLQLKINEIFRSPGTGFERRIVPIFLTVFVRILRMNRFYCVVTYFSILFLALPSVCLSIMSLSVYPSLSLSVYLSVCLGTRMFSLTIVKKY